MKMKMLRRSSPALVFFALLGFSIAPVLAQDYGAPPAADQIKAIQEQAMREAQSQVQGQGQAPANVPAAGFSQGFGNIPGGMPANQNFGPPPGVEAMQQKGEEMQKQAGQQQLKGLQQGARGMENALKQFENMQKNVQKAGGKMSDEAQAKFQQIKQNIQTIKNAKSAEEIEEIETDGLQDDINSLMEDAQKAMQDVQQLKGLKQGMKGMEQGLKQFESQLARIAKQKVAIPAEIKEKVAGIKTKIAAVKTAKTWDEAEAAGVEDLQDSMESLNDYRDQLEVLMRLPMMQKQMDQQMARLNTEVKKTGTIVAKLKKQGIDLAEEQAAFAAGVAQMKTVRDNALAQVKSGNPEAIKTALDDLEENFFGQMTDVMEYSRVIQTMSSLSRFAADLKKNLTAAQTQINQLKRKKINTTELESLLNQAKAKGAEVTALTKAKPLDTDAVMDGIAALEDLRTQFDDKAVELGGGAAMPWETGPDQFKDVGDYNLDKYLPKK